MAAPNPKEGLQAEAKIKIQQAMQLLESTLKPDVFPYGGPEWKALDNSLKQLSKLAGNQQGKELGAAGLKSIAAGLSPKGMPGVMGEGGGGGQPGQPQGMPMAGPSPMSIIGNLMGGGGMGG